MKQFVVGLVMGALFVSSMAKVSLHADLVAKRLCKKPVPAPRAYWTMTGDGLGLGCNIAFTEVR